MEAPRTSSQERGRRQRQNYLIIGGVLAVLAAALAYAAWDGTTEVPEQVAPITKPQLANNPTGEKITTHAPPSNVIDDDGQSVWVSPTDGPPLDLAYLPPGVEIILALRPEELLANSEGEKLIAACGPRGAEAVSFLEEAIGVSLNTIQQLIVGWQVARDGSYVPTIVVTTVSAIEPPAGAFQPEARHGRVTIIAPTAALQDICVLEGHAPPLARDLERLLAHTDAARGVTLLVQPRSLLVGANAVFVGESHSLRQPLESLLGRNIAAAALSLDWSDSFFAELLAVPTLDSSHEQLSEQLAAQVQSWPDDIDEAVLALNASGYSRRVVARLPEMVRRLAAYTRHGYDRDAAILRCYLPVTAGHNLLMATELALAEGQGSGKHIAALPTAAAASTASISERLQLKTSLRFAREELEAALNMLGRDVGVPINIRGQDLQLDGITRNQLFAIDVADAPAEEILVEILRRANPDKTAAGPADPRQKLVYVVGLDAIIITTRSQAAVRGESLPTAFQAE